MRRLSELDGLRGLAVIGIVLFHYSNPSWLYDHALYIGCTTLELFFVLSGFLITSIILRGMDGGSFLVRFYARRSLRIWPIYYLTLFAVIAMSRLKPGMFPMQGLFQYLTYTQNIEGYWGGTPRQLAYPFGLTWSLAIEEQFYILWPLLLLVVGRRGVIPAAFAFMAIAVAARWGGYSSHLLLARCDGFALGGLLAALLDKDVAPTRMPIGLRPVLWLTGIAALARMTLGQALQGRRPFDITVEATGLHDTILPLALFFFSVVGLVVLHAGSPGLAPLRFGPLVHVGKISYGLYLYHLFVVPPTQALVARLGLPRILTTSLQLCVLLVVANLSWYLVEQPFLRLKDRFDYREHGVPVTGEQLVDETAGIETVPIQS
jgi:peptidoglycan/LPS O-acetylase OafA/YrhL